MKRVSSYSTNVYLALLVRLGIVMLLLSVSRVIFYLLNADMFGNMTCSHFLRLMAGGLPFDLTATLYTNALFIVGNIAPFRFRHRLAYQSAMRLVFFFCNGVMFAVNSIDFVYYRFTQRRTTWSVVDEFWNDAGNFALMGHFARDYWYVALIWSGLMAVLVQLYGRVCVREPRASGSAYYAPSSLLAVFFCGLFLIGVRGGIRPRVEPIGIANAASYVGKPAEIAIVLNTPFSLFRTLGKQALRKPAYFASERELEAVYTPVHTPEHDTLAFNPENVVVIVLESMSKEYIGSLNRDLDDGNYKGYTPFLDSLIAHSLTYTHSFANGTKSLDVVPSVFASIPSLVEHYSISMYSNNHIRGLASHLAEKGYDCSFFHGANNGSMRFDATASIAGFQHYYGKTEFNNNAEYDGHWGIWDEPFMQFFAHTLNQKSEPFLGAIFTVTSHHPFVVPAAYEGAFPKGTEEIHHTIGYVDMSLRRFFDTAKKMPWFDNTLFVITADHTNQVSYEKSRTGLGRFAIPIIFHHPSGKLKGLDQSRTVQQIDIMPSVLNYLRYDKPYFSFGFDAMSKDSACAFAINYNGAFQVACGGYVLHTREEGPSALYHYASDPLEQHDIKDSEPAIALDLDNRFRAFLQQYNGRLIENRMTE